MNRIIFPFLIIISILITACHDEVKFTEDGAAKLGFSTDTLHFDTVFTTIGSTTKQIRIYNPNSNAIKTTIELANGANSYFRLNIDGFPSNKIKDLEIMGNDSIYIFAELNVDPQNSNSPMVINDSIVFLTNGNQQDIKLVAYGQDVHLYTDSVIDTRTWINDKPYLLYGWAIVDSLETLNINPGVQVYLHNNASLVVYGTLNVTGTKDEMVVFQGDRLDEYYKDIPGQWGKLVETLNGPSQLAGIHIWRSSQNNVIDYAEIKNSKIGVQVHAEWPNNLPTTNPTLVLSNSIIHTMSLIGLEARTANVATYNSVIVNCGYYCARLMYGGNYEFYHSTIANYFPSNYGGRNGEALAIQNYYVVNDTATTFPFNAHFGNCVIYGNSAKEDEIIVLQADDTPFSWEFDHCMIKLSDEFDTSDENVFKNIIRHKDSLPRFIDTESIDFRLDTLSSAKDKGSDYYGNIFPTDLDGNSRINDDGPDLGAYERIENDESE